MGTPLSFIVLSWISAWAASAFSGSITHGDDAVGCAVDLEELNDYSAAVESVGASMNVSKTFTSMSCFTFCETASFKTGNKGGRICTFIPPPCPAPGLKFPVVAEGRAPRLYLNRQERVMKTLFPYMCRDARLHLPVEVGGFGYVGRGLRIARSLRQRLAKAVSRGANPVLGAALCTSKAFREEGLYPRLLVPAPKMPGEFYSLQKMTASPFLERPGSGTSVPLKSLVAHRARITQAMWTNMNKKMKRVRDSGRPERTKGKALFRSCKGLKPMRALTVRFGHHSLVRHAQRCREMEVEVFPDVALMIRGRTTNS